MSDRLRERRSKIKTRPHRLYCTTVPKEVFTYDGLYRDLVIGTTRLSGEEYLKPLLTASTQV